MPLAPETSQNPRTGNPSVAQPVEDPRVYLAAERTFLAWIRTSLAIMGFGFVIARFAFWMREFGPTASNSADQHHRISTWLGFGMVVVGILVSVASARRHRAYIQALRNGVANPPLDLNASMAIALILGLVGVAMAAQLLLS